MVLFWKLRYQNKITKIPTPLILCYDKYQNAFSNSQWIRERDSASEILLLLLSGRKSRSSFLRRILFKRNLSWPGSEGVCVLSNTLQGQRSCTQDTQHLQRNQASNWNTHINESCLLEDVEFLSIRSGTKGDKSVGRGVP